LYGCGCRNEVKSTVTEHAYIPILVEILQKEMQLDSSSESDLSFHFDIGDFIDAVSWPFAGLESQDSFEAWVPW
jgi:hypothetical protein